MPKIAANRPPISYDQQLLVAKLKRYLELKKAKLSNFGDRLRCILPFDTEDGLCSGLLSYWLYSVRIGEEGRFLHKLTYTLTLDEDKFRASAASADATVEEFMNNVALLQHDFQLRTAVVQDNMQASFALLLNNFYPQVAPAEYQLTFVFNLKTLLQMLNQIAQPDKMIRINNGFHVVGLIVSENRYYYYNPTAQQGPATITTLAELAAKIITDLSAYCHSKRYIALNIVVADLVEAAINQYQDPMQFYQQLLANRQYRSQVLKHKNIFKLGVACANYAMLDLLFAAGYTYIPWHEHGMTEISTAIMLNDTQALQYLFQHQIPLDHQPRFGLTALGTTIVHHKYDGMYTLLAAGANPNVEPTGGCTALQLALQDGSVFASDSAPAVTLLLAFGVKIGKKELELLNENYSEVELQSIFDHALQLNAKLMHLPNVVDLNTADSQTTMKLLLNRELQAPLQGPDELNALLAAITKHIITTPLVQHSPADLEALAVILRNITDLSHYTSPVRRAAVSAKKAIQAYFARQHIRIPNLQTENLLLYASKIQPAVDITYESDIAPLLSLERRVG